MWPDSAEGNKPYARMLAGGSSSRRKFKFPVRSHIRFAVRGACRRYSLAAAAAAILCATVVWGRVAANTGFSQSRNPIVIALTRQEGENHKLKDATAQKLSTAGFDSSQIGWLEVPCIEHAVSPEANELENVLRATVHADVSGADSRMPRTVLLTSPEGARFFMEMLDVVRVDVDKIPFRIACVGTATAAVVTRRGLNVDFKPTAANAETLAAELPLRDFGPDALYVASDIAPCTLQNGLEKKGFKVHRINAYITRTVQSPSHDAVERMANVDIVTFGSPSAVHGWTSLTARRPPCACIGSTSKLAAKNAGFHRVFAPGTPGLSGWVQAVLACIKTFTGDATET